LTNRQCCHVNIPRCMLEETAHVWCAPPEHTHNRGKVSYVIHPLDTPLAHFTVVRAVWPPMRTLLAKVSLPRRPLATASVPRNEPRVF